MFFGSGGPPAVGRSSAVPVLPATSTPGMRAAVPVPPRTTPIIIARTWRATRARTARWRITGSLRTIRGLARTPRSAIVAPTLAISSGVARSRSWPMAAAPTARLSFSALGCEIRIAFAAGIRGRSLNPNRSAAATSRRAPSFAPSGANTELHDTTNALTSEPPHASLLALRSSTPDSRAAVRTG